GRSRRLNSRGSRSGITIGPWAGKGQKSVGWLRSTIQGWSCRHQSRGNTTEGGQEGRMDHQDVTLTRLESEAAETVGAMRELFKEFEKRIGEVVSVQRLSSSEARTEGAQVLQHLQELARCSRDLVDQQRSALGRIEQEWQLRIDGNAQRAGEAQARAFGESIAQGLQGRLADLAAHVETS